MMADLHFLRPWCLLALLPLAGLMWYLWRQNPRMQSLKAVCDEHLLAYLIQNKGERKRHGGLLLLFLSGVFMSIGMAGPTWFRLPLPSYHALQARVLVLDLSPGMLTRDLTPDRLTRAKFKLHDLLQAQQKGQFGLVVYTGEPFVVSPLTEDGNTIDSLLETLTPAIMPVSGQQLDSALEQAGQLITQAGFAKGQLLVLTASTPDKAAITMAAKLYNKGIETSIMPVVADKALPPFFQPLATAGHGLLLPIADTSKDIQQWLHATSNSEQLRLNAQNDIPSWRDEGRWFIVPALLFLLPVFWRGWLQRIES